MQTNFVDRTASIPAWRIKTDKGQPEKKETPSQFPLLKYNVNMVMSEYLKVKLKGFSQM